MAEGSYFEYRKIYFGGGESLKIHLMSRLQPWRWPIMLASQGIRVEREGKAVPNLTLEHQLRSGDVVVIDDAYGKTWLDLMHEATVNYRDYVFCPHRASDQFLLDQVKALLMREKTLDVPLVMPTGSVAIPHLYALVASLTPLAERAIRYLIIVSHANPFGEILMPMHALKGSRDAPDPSDDFADRVYWESLQEAIATKPRNPLQIHEQRPNVPRRADGTQEGVFPKVLPRPERSDGKFAPFAVIIRGCSSGVHTIFLNKIREAFGVMVDIVVMPKFFDATHTVNREMVEFFQHEFSVSSKTELTRAQVISALKAKKMTDWKGTPVPDTDWNDLVPKNVGGTQTTPMKRITVRVKERDQRLALTTWFDSQPLPMTTREMKQKDEPDAAAIKQFLIEGLARKPFFRDGAGDWPIWLRLGLANRAEFEDYFTYRVDPAAPKKPGVWPVHGIRHFWIVRTPLLEGDTLVADYHPGRDGAKPSYGIDYNDDRIFGRSDATKNSDPNSRVGVNFSRKL